MLRHIHGQMGTLGSDNTFGLLRRFNADESIDLVHVKPRSFPAILFIAVCLCLSRPATVHAAQLTIGVIGDYGAAYAGGASFSNEQAVANLIKGWNPDFIITTGDKQLSEQRGLEYRHEHRAVLSRLYLPLRRHVWRGCQLEPILAQHRQSRMALRRRRAATLSGLLHAAGERALLQSPPRAGGALRGGW